jgi:proteasome lid subunit RPN8/RPN11
MIHELILPAPIITAMRRHVRRRLPLEACGLLAGRGGRVERVVGVHNALRSPVRYLMDARQQWHAFERFEQLGLDLLGIYHSHPTGPARPSPTDIDQALYAAVQVIWWQDDGLWQANGFWIEAGQVSPVKLTVQK